MNYLQFKYNPNKELYKVFHMLLVFRSCKIYISKSLYHELLHYLCELPMKHYSNMKFLCAGILEFPKADKIIIPSDRVRDGIFYVGKN